MLDLIITVYNRERYLAQAIDSVIAQTYPFWQLTIWDDGSTDDSIYIAKKYARLDSRITVIASEHQGRVKSMQDAVATTSGEYLGFLDSDDYLAPDALRSCVDILEACASIFDDRHLDYGMVYSDHYRIDESGRMLSYGTKHFVPYSKERLLDDFMTFHFRLIRRSIYNLVGGVDLNFPQAQDYDLCLKISEVSEIYHLDKFLYYYRVHPNSISGQQKQQQAERTIAASNNAKNRRRMPCSVNTTTSQYTTGAPGERPILVLKQILSNRDILPAISIIRTTGILNRNPYQALWMFINGSLQDVSFTSQVITSPNTPIYIGSLPPGLTRADGLSKGNGKYDGTISYIRFQNVI